MEGYRDTHTGSVKIMEWESKTDFITWLADQSDYSLSGADQNELFEEDAFLLNNQRITRRRCIDFVKKELINQ